MSGKGTLNKDKNYIEVRVPNSTIKQNEPLIHATTWVNLKIITQSKEARHYVITFL